MLLTLTPTLSQRERGSEVDHIPSVLGSALGAASAGAVA